MVVVAVERSCSNEIFFDCGAKCKLMTFKDIFFFSNLFNKQILFTGAGVRQTDLDEQPVIAS